MSEKLLQPGLSGHEEATEETAAPHLGEESWRPATEEELRPARVDTGMRTEEEKWPNEWHVICWMLASGSSQRAVAAELDYAENRISTIANMPVILRKINEIRETHFGAGLQKRFSQVAPKAMNVMEEVITGKGAGQSAKVSEKLQAATWVLEKVTGKPTQNIDLDGGGTIVQLLSALDKLNLKPGAVPTEEGRDVIELARAPADPLDDWVSQNVPEPKQEKKQQESKDE